MLSEIFHMLFDQSEGCAEHQHDESVVVRIIKKIMIKMIIEKI